LLPPLPNSATPFLAVQAGKEGVLRLLNRRNLSGSGGPGHLGGELQTLDAPDHCPVLTQPVTWADPDGGHIWVFVSNGCAIGGYQVVTSPQGKTTLRKAWSIEASATSPILAGRVLFAATGLNGLVALDPRTGKQLWTSTHPAAGGSIGNTHWESPIVVDGRLYCSDEQGQISAYSL
jgi:outer membrane protein assembly factor BamB